MRQNWVYNSAESGIRFDSPWREPNVYGRYGTIERNVIWNTRRIQPKVDNHWVYNNTAFDNERGDLSIFSVLEHGGVNKNTITRNNAINTLTGSNNKGEIIPIHGVHDHNWVGLELGKDVKDQLRDPDNFDFRPKSGSELIDRGMVVAGVTDGYMGDAPDIGAYEFGDVNYWIPGRQMSGASFPIPLNGGKTHTSLVDLIWLEGYKAGSHDVYFGSSKDVVEIASKSSPAFKGNQTSNIFNPAKLEAGKTYYWRIDAVLLDSKVVKGKVWKFTADIDAH